MSDIRWIQRFSNFQKALKQLENGVYLYKTRPLTDLEKQGIIKAFEYTYDLSWNLLRDYLLYQGIQDIRGPRDAFRFGFQYNIIKSDVFISMIQSRNLSSHTYNEDIVFELLEKIIKNYYPAFLELYEYFKAQHS